jgi:hypothetical protein
MIAQNLGWDRGFWPGHGWFQTDSKYWLDVGDSQYVRIATPKPDSDGLEYFGWRKLGTRSQTRYELEPFLMVRLDLRRIASVLGRVEGWNRRR